MSWRRSAAVMRQDLRILRSDPVFLVVMIAMPLLVMAFIKPAFRAALVESGVSNANGAEQVVPGTTTLFAFFLMGNLGFAVFREHGWNTWERLRASRATPAEIMIGKSVTPLLSLALQLSVLFGLGGLAFDLDVHGSYVALVLVAASLAICLVSLGFLLLALCRTVMQLNAVTNLGTMLFAGLGGAIAPITVLPGWARAIAPGVPSYWAMRGFRSVIIEPGGIADALPAILMLLAFTIAFAIVAGIRFRVEETKLGFA